MRFAFARCLGLIFAAAGAVYADERPNVVLVLADDLGFSDLGCYGGEIRTPRIDALAAEGLRFRQFYNCARCCPTRAALLTGRSPHEVGLRFNGRSLSRDVPTVAETLRSAGYRTAMSGKWHLSQAEALNGGDFNSAEHLAWLNHRASPGPLFAARESYPVARGFERHYGIIWGVVNHFDPFSLVDGYEPVLAAPEGFHLTDAISDHAAGCIREFSRGEEPFFLYVAYTAPHWPLHAFPEDIARYQKEYGDGWQALREARYRRQIELGLIDAASHPLPQTPPFVREWNGLKPAERARESAKMRVHAAMVDRMDQGVGRIVDVLRETNEFDQTLILFLSDNGASPEAIFQPGYDRPSETRDGRAIRYRDFPSEETGGETTYTMIGPDWATACNTPFRYWKKHSFEGGQHTPCIAHWPGGLKTPPGSLTDAVGHVIDVVPTVLELAGIEPPAANAGGTTSPLPGRSLAPLWRGEPMESPRTLYFEHEGGAAIRDGDWKLVRLNPRSRWELYDLSGDRTETVNFAGEQPERVRELAKEWQTWFDRVTAGAADESR